MKTVKLPEIKGIVFDLGGTLEDVWPSEQIKSEALPLLRTICDAWGFSSNRDDETLLCQIEQGMLRYKKWKEETLQELSAQQVCSTFVFPKEVKFHGNKQLWDAIITCYEQKFFSRAVRKDTKEVLLYLQQKNFKLGVISNIISDGVVYDQLEKHSIKHFFSTIMTSAETGKRKPDPFMFTETAKRLDISPKHLMYVGDTISRDVIGSIHAGYGASVYITSQMSSISDSGCISSLPYISIETLTDLYNLV